METLPGGKLMKRYQVQDPTGQGFPQVIDMSGWERCLLWSIRPPFVSRSHRGNTYVVATFTAYCPDAFFHAQNLISRLDDYTRQIADHGATLPDQITAGADIHVMDSLNPMTEHPTSHKHRALSVAVISKWCPNGLVEAATLVQELNDRYPVSLIQAELLPLTSPRFSLHVMPTEDELRNIKSDNPEPWGSAA